MLSGCQGNNSDSQNTVTSDTNTTIQDTNETLPETNTTVDKYTIVLPVSSTVLKTNSQVVNIDVRMFDGNNNPYSGGKIVKINPDDVLKGRDIGTFDKDESTLVNGVATFTYTAPSDLDANTSNISFAFYHDSNSSDRRVYTMSIVPEANQTALTSYDLYTSVPIGYSMGLESRKNISYFIKDENGKLVSDQDTKSIVVETLNPSLIALSDSQGNSGSKLSFSDKNSISLNLTTNTKSGLVPIKVSARFIDTNGDEQNLTKVFDVLVLSGPPTAMSLSYVGTIEKSDNAKFIQKVALTVTDRYNNLVNTKPTVSMGALAGYAKDSSGKANNSAGYLYFTSGDDDHNGKLTASDDKFTAQDEVFEKVDQTNQYLITFGNGYTYNASGKWDIKTDTNKTLELVDDYNGSDTEKLGFAVGNNFRQDMCEDGVEWVANVYPEDSGNYVLPETGSMNLYIEYDYYLTGKDIVLWVNLLGSHNGEMMRIGEARKMTLRGNGLTSETYSFSKGFQGKVTLHIMVSDTEYLKNSNFRYAVKVDSDDANWTVVDDSMNHNITHCYGYQNQTGDSYVDINFTSPTPKAGTVSLQNLIIGSEF